MTPHHHTMTKLRLFDLVETLVDLGFSETKILALIRKLLEHHSISFIGTLKGQEVKLCGDFDSSLKPTKTKE